MVLSSFSCFIFHSRFPEEPADQPGIGAAAAVCAALPGPLFWAAAGLRAGRHHHGGSHRPPTQGLSSAVCWAVELTVIELFQHWDALWNFSSITDFWNYQPTMPEKWKVHQVFLLIPGFDIRWNFRLMKYSSIMYCFRFFLVCEYLMNTFLQIFWKTILVCLYGTRLIF